MEHSLTIVINLTVGFTLAAFFGYFFHRIHLPSMAGYLLAGYIMGPYSPGFVADIDLSKQLAEVGLIFMLFGVGLEFKMEDLLHVRSIAVPGAIGQTAATALAGGLLFYFLGWSLESAVVLGVSISVASTAVLTRILSEKNLLNTLEGHISMGWLIVEDILTIGVLILLPVLTSFFIGESLPLIETSFSLFWALFKLFAFGILMMTWGHRIISTTLRKIAQSQSNELLGLSVLAIIFVTASGSALIFGTSLAIGAFIAGLVVGKTDLKYQAAANALPLRECFAAIFFLSIGMLFNPEAILEQPSDFLILTGIVIIGKPLVTFLIIIFFDYSVSTALTVAISLAQIGEFSFILSEQSVKLDLMPERGFDLIVATALISISINPLLIKLLDFLKDRKEKSVNRMKVNILSTQDHSLIDLFRSNTPLGHSVVIVGLGSLGRQLVFDLKETKFVTSIIENDIDRYNELKEKGFSVIFGDGRHQSILKSAGLESAKFLLITINQLETATAVIAAARIVNPNVQILAYLTQAKSDNRLKSLHIDLVNPEKEASRAFIKRIFLIERAKKHHPKKENSSLEETAPLKITYS